MIGTQCKRLGCPNLARHGHYCDAHKLQERSPDNRPCASERGYDGHWHKLRNWVLCRDCRVCAACGMPGDTVDHVVPRSAGGDDDPSNLQTLCRRCHKHKTDEDRRRALLSGLSVDRKP